MTNCLVANILAERKNFENIIADTAANKTLSALDPHKGSWVCWNLTSLINCHTSFWTHLCPHRTLRQCEQPMAELTSRWRNSFFLIARDAAGILYLVCIVTKPVIAVTRKHAQTSTETHTFAIVKRSKYLTIIALLLHKCIFKLMKIPRLMIEL